MKINRHGFELLEALKTLLTLVSFLIDEMKLTFAPTSYYHENKNKMIHIQTHRTQYQYLKFS